MMVNELYKLKYRMTSIEVDMVESIEQNQLVNMIQRPNYLTIIDADAAIETYDKLL